MLGFTVITTLLAHESRSHLTNLGIHAFTADVTKDEDIIELRKKVTEIGGGGLKFMVNNA
jgi:1-acylglycerone phosphate reductase